MSRHRFRRFLTPLAASLILVASCSDEDPSAIDICLDLVRELTDIQPPGAAAGDLAAIQSALRDASNRASGAGEIELFTAIESFRTLVDQTAATGTLIDYQEQALADGATKLTMACGY